MLEQPLNQKLLNPLTPAGVARFARASFGKMLSIGFVFACMAGAAVIWLAAKCWSPAISEAVEALPANSVIEAGQFFWPEKLPRLLGANEFLSIEVNPGNERAQSKPSDIAIILEPHIFRLGSLFGYTSLPYPQRWVIQCNRDSMSPLWGAWQPAILLALGLGTALGLLISWALFALLYSFYPWLIAALFKRDLSLGQAWKVSYAAMFPGSILVTFSLLLYLHDEISLVFFLILFAAHFPLAWLYIFLASFCFKKAESNEPLENPFELEKKKRKSKNNPFSTGSSSD
jgi:hypothetical protein